MAFLRSREFVRVRLKSCGSPVGGGIDFPKGYPLGGVPDLRKVDIDILLAGPAAEAIFYKRPLWKGKDKRVRVESFIAVVSDVHVGKGGGHDVLQAREFIYEGLSAFSKNRPYEEVTGPSLEQAWLNVEIVLREPRNWRGIQKVAAMLVEQQTLIASSHRQRL